MYDRINDADIGWHRDLKHVLDYGTISKPRGMEVKESLSYQSVVQMRNPIIYNETRKLGYKFMAAEAAWILSGRDDVGSIAPFSKEISKFSDDGVKFFGAYGPPLMEQLPYVLRCLKDDSDSRQALVTIWRQSPGPSRDIPCTVALQFLVRHGVLHCVASMRSSDLWLGHPYDVFNFSAISFFVMMMLNKERDSPLILGYLFLTAGSKHIYQRNFEAVEQVVSVDPAHYFRKDVFVEDRYDSPDEFVSYLWACAESKRGALTLEE